jgi:hypothetical protein
MNKIEKNNRKFFNKIYKKIKKHKFRTFIRKILTKKYKYGKHAKIIIFDEIHNYKEDNSLLENLYTTNWLDTRKEIFKNNLVNIYQANYMQNPFKILTEENLNRLEEHCKKAIRYERGELKKEHEVTLELLYQYQKQEEEIVKQNKIINLMSEKIFEEGIVWDNKEVVIDYFRKKVEAKENE